MANNSNSLRVFRFEVQGEDLVMDFHPKHSLFNLMSFVCDTWLDDARDGDGGVEEHMWTIKSPLCEYDASHVGPFPMRTDPDDIVETAQESTMLKDLQLQPGSELPVVYDMGTSSHFTIVLKSIETIEKKDSKTGEAIKLPRTVTLGENNYSTVFQPHEVPEEDNGGINLDQEFPFANELLFQSVAQWILLFPCSSTCAGAVEAGPNAMSDMVFMPNKFASVKEYLIALNEAGKHQPDEWTRPDAYARLVFPLKLETSDEEKFQAFKLDLDKFHNYCKDHNVDKTAPLTSHGSMPEEYLYRLCSAEEVVIRVTDESMEEFKDVDLAKSFPLLCEKAFDGGFWFSYRRGKLLLSQGECREQRGVPQKILAQAERKINSLHELFCCAEALFKTMGTHDVWKKKGDIVNLASINQHK